MSSAAFRGQCASPGFASGTVVEPDRAAAIRAGRNLDGGAAELRQAIAAAIGELGDLAANAEGEGADMLAFQIAMLEDDALSEAAFAAIANGENAEAAWGAALDAEIAGYEASDDAYFRARAADLADIRDRVLDRLAGRTASRLDPGSIVLADDLTPSRFLSAQWQGGAILLRKGSATSHVAMLARARGVPMIVGLPVPELAGKPVIVDAGTGLVVVEPSHEDEARFAGLRAAGLAAEAEAAAFRTRPAFTRDGVKVEILLNIADPAELDGLDPAICDGIGLVRTELLFEGQSLPGEDVQFAAYAKIVRWAAGRPVTFRTLDAGGDKPIPGLTPEGESNPFLGVRGIRLTLARPEILLAQLRAFCRAAALGPVEIMLPMVTVPRELEAARVLLAEAAAALTAEGVAHRLPPLGMMVEVPAAALTPARFDAAFFSIGSNDLTQYVMAAGRDIAAVAELADAGDPAVLRLVAELARHGAQTGRKVSLCGDAGGDPRLIPALLAAGLRHLSMAPRLVGRAKQVIAGLDAGGCHG